MSNIDVNITQQSIDVTVSENDVLINVVDSPVYVNVNEQPITVEVSGVGPQGPAGEGVPTGGTTGQVLAKVSNTNYDTHWITAGAGSVTSVDMTVPTGLSISGNPITTSGTLALALSSGYVIPTQAEIDAKVPYTGATGNVDLGEYEIKAGQFTLDTSPTGTAAVGTTRWNNSTGITETTLKGGNVILKNGVDLVARVVNKVTPNATLTKAQYQAVRVTGAQGQRLAVAYAQANNDNNSADTIGIVIETIPTNQEGFIMTVGQLEGINTTGSLQGETWTDGDVLYLSPTTPGALTNVKPVAPQHIVVMGYVEYAHANNGKIYVKVMNGWELGELHDVNTAGATNGQVLTYNGSIWVPSTNASGTVTSVAATAGTGISVSGSPITTSGTLTITNTAPDQIVSLTGAGTTSISGTYPSFTITSNDQYTGTVTSVNLAVPTGFSLSGNPITTSGTITIGFASGYSLPTTAKQTEWDTAYTNRITSLTTTGSSGAATLISNTLNIPNYTLSGLGGVPSSRTLTINGTGYDLSADRSWSVGTITALTGEATASGTGSVSITLDNASVIGKVLTGLNLTGGGTISATDTILQAFGKVQNQISALVGSVQYEGVWNASTNSPTILGGTGNKGDYYVVNVAGTVNIDGIGDWKVGDWIIFNGTTWDKVDNTDAVSSVNGFTGAVSLSTSNISEGTNLYFTNTRARNAITLTTTGTSGAATYSGGTLNIPVYSISGLGGVPTTRQLTINGTAYDLSADRSWSVGTVTSIGLTTSTTGVTIGSSPVTSSGSITIDIATASSSANGLLSSTDWSTFNSKQAALNGTGFVKISGTTISYDNSTYYLASNPSSYIALTALSASAPLSYNSGTGAFSISQASGSSDGYLSSTDWTTFNNKQNALTNPVTGTGATNYLAKFTSTGSIIGNSAITEDGTTVSILNRALSGVSASFSSTVNGLSFSTNSNSYYQLGYGSDAASRSWQIKNDELDPGDLNIMQSTTRVGATYSTKLRIKANGETVLSGALTGTSATFSSSVQSTRLGLNFAPQSNIRAFIYDNSTDYGLVVQQENSSGTIAQFSGGGGSLKMIINGAGNLGLGVTPSAWIAYTAIQVTNGGSFYAYQYPYEQIGVVNNGYFNGSNWIYTNTGSNPSRYHQYAGEHLFYTAPSGTAGNAITFTQAMTLDANGRLMIGLTSALTRGGAAGVSINASFASALSIGLSDNDIMYVRRGGATAVYQFQTNDTGANTGQIHLQPYGGNVGIGTTSPSYKLDVQGGTIANGNGTIVTAITYATMGIVGTLSNHDLALYSNNTERMRITSGGELLVGKTGIDWSVIGIQTENSSKKLGITSDASDNNLFLRKNNTTGIMAQFFYNGTSVGDISISTTSTSYNTSSDYRLKTDLKDFAGVDIVKSLKVYDYQWISDNSRCYGVLAHELQNIIPYAVNGEKDGDRMQGVDYSKLVPVLVKAIQELKGELDELKLKINA